MARFAACCAFALLLIATVAAAQAAPKGYASPTFAKYMIDARFGQLPGKSAKAAKASVASAGREDQKPVTIANEADYYGHYGYDSHHESKQLCLAEQRQRNCAMYGCQDSVDNGCDENNSTTGGGTCGTNPGQSCGTGCNCDGAQPCFNCRIGNYYTSDLTCLKEEHYNYGYGNYGPSNFFSSQSMIGSCDWTIMWLRRDKSDTQGTGAPITAAGTCTGGENTTMPSDNTCGWQVVYEDQTYKVGTATANCYFSAEADRCGEPFCNRLLVTLQADVYVSVAYSHQNASVAQRDPCCFAWDNIDNADCGAVNIYPWDGPSVTANAPQSAEKAAKANYGRDSYATATETTYEGGAVIISGSVTAINGQKYESRYDDGQFEYVPYFLGNNKPVTAIDPNVPWVKPNSYKFEFYKDGAKYYSQ